MRRNLNQNEKQAADDSLSQAACFVFTRFSCYGLTEEASGKGIIYFSVLFPLTIHKIPQHNDMIDFRVPRGIDQSDIRLFQLL